MEKNTAPPVDPKAWRALLEERYRREIMGEEARCELRENIVRLRRRENKRHDR